MSVVGKYPHNHSTSDKFLLFGVPKNNVVVEFGSGHEMKFAVER